MFEIDPEPPIDKETGLPQLPEGYAWEVFTANNYLHVQIMELRKFRLVRPVPGFCSVEKPNPALIPYAARQAIKMGLQAQADQRRDAELKRKCGFYPPKSLT